MKLNVKGLVFVGFAAAILSANAMAATGDEKIVTSKAFTEATYQAKLSGGDNEGKVVTAGATDGSVTYTAIDTAVTANSSNLVTSGAVSTAIANQGLGNTYEVLDNKLDDSTNKTIATNGDSTTLYPSAKAVKTYADSKVSSAGSVGTSTTVAPNEKAVSDALALKQAASTAVKYDGTNAVGSATTPVYVNSNGTVTASTYTIETSVPANAVFTDTTYDTLDAATVTTGTEETGKLVTAKVLRDELDNKVTKNNNITAGTATKITYDAKGLVTAGGSLLASDIPDISATYQLRQLGAAGEGGADSVDKDKLVYLGADGKIAKSGMKVTSSVTQNDTNPVTSGAVYSYINALSGSSIPNGSNCSAEAPCALVATGTNTFAWVPMSQPSNN